MNKKNNLINLDEENSSESSLNPLINNDYVFVTSEPKTFNIYHVYLLEKIWMQKYYRELLDILRKCSPGELVNIYIYIYKQLWR